MPANSIPLLNTEQKVIQVLIVDDHPAVREGLAIRISRQADLAVFGEAADAAEALELLGDHLPDVAVVDIALKNASGLDLIRRLKSRYPSIRMLVWSMYDESHYAARALQAGALGYITKEHATDKIIEAIRQVFAGKIYLSDMIAEQILHRAVVEGDAEKSIVEKLSDRELQVFRFLGEGWDTHEIAESMQVSPKTVETYRARIKQKLNVHKNNELIRQAVHWLVTIG